MKAARRSALTMTALVACLTMAGAASAGGSWISPQRPAYVPGQIASFRGSFSTGSLEGTVGDGPYHAYLMPRNAWIRNDVVPASAIRVGELRIARDDTHMFRAVVRFEVPSVPSGSYHIGYCNDPCTVNGIGDLIGSDTFTIAATRAEGQVLRRNERLRERIQTTTVGRQRLAAEAARLARDLRATEAQLAGTRARVDRLGDELVEARRQRGLEGESSGHAWTVAVITSGLGAALLAVVFLQTRSLRRARLDAELLSLTTGERLPTRR